MKILKVLVVLIMLVCLCSCESKSGRADGDSVQSSAKTITAFTFTNVKNASLVTDVAGTISVTTISVTLPAGISRSSLIATFSTTGTSVTVGGIPQVSGVTVVDFTNPVVYVVTAQDGSIQNYSVTVNPVNLASAIMQYGITWTFDKAYPTGQFVNGDYWVVGPITVVSVNPPPTIANGAHLNGSMINPPNGSQSYDSRTTYFGHPYNTTLLVSYPVTVATNSSLVSTISVNDPQDPNPRPSLQSASVLTVLVAAPPEGSFRPGLIGTFKKLYNVNDIRWNLLPGLSPTAAVPSANAIADKYTRGLQRPWLLHGTGWLHRHIMPVDNSPSYHRNVALLLNEAAVLCVTNWGDRTDLVTNYIQVAIDYYAMQKNGVAPGKQGAYNYRWPTIFAGIMLGDNEMRDMWINHTYSTPSYHYNAIYYWEDQKRTLHSNILPAEDTWTGYHQRTGKKAVFYDILNMEQPDIACHEELHPSEWSTLIDIDEYPGGGIKQETYRQMNSVSIPGFSLAAFAFNAKSYMDYPAYFDYADRWMTETLATLEASGDGAHAPYGPRTTTSPFVDEMWYEYRGDF